MILSKEKLGKLEKMGYRFVGINHHAATKVCHWTKKSILDEGVCYKEKFYGIESHRCLQMSPSIPFCQQKCLFCWRDQSVTDNQWMGEYDEPKEIIEGCIKAQRNLLCGFFGNENANTKKIKEAQDPTNAAISLAGEPIIYPGIDELLMEFKKRKFTTFLVSNGLMPSKLENLENEPTQLYISLDAPNKEIYNTLCRPQIKNGWEKLNKSLDLFETFNSRTVVRITCVKGYNMQNAKEYADIIKSSGPEFVEIKAYMYVGYSRKRLKLENMPSFMDVKDFSEKISQYCGYELINSSEDSRVVLLSRE
ncbi:MAG: 4-demethylwyosine synthase TYW1 [Methanobacteriaceae archaeon]|nr:4-demethylwyosine synthase TYW1 [Methanobacteriaceae archaeon]